MMKQSYLYNIVSYKKIVMRVLFTKVETGGKLLKKNALALCLVFAVMLSIQSCDEGFESLNTNPDAVSDITPEYMFTLSQLDALNAAVFSSHITSTGGFMQQYATYKDVPSLGDRYTWSQGGYPYDFFNTIYPNAIKEIGEVIRAVADDPELINMYAAARVWRVLIMQQLTDFYGDIPYSEAGKGYSETIYTPKYDSQSDIYADMLNELEEAANAFTSEKETFGSSDLLYDGDVTQWKKFTYSLMLRLAFRLTKVDESMAENWVEKAISGGVFTDEVDIARIEYTDGPQTLNYNPYAYALVSGDYGVSNGIDNKEGGKLAETFISHLKNTNDPRLNAIAIVWNNGVADTTTSLQKGMPNGLVGGSAPDDFVSYSEPNPSTLLKYNSPYLVLTDAEVNLLLAEASIRGWYSGDANEAYQNAIRSALGYWSLYDVSAGTISDARKESYLTNNQLDGSTFDEKMEQIHTQFWVSVFPNDIEIYANWRRTGYPELVPVDVPGNLTNGTIPRRLIYPPSEESLNGANYTEAVNKIEGGNSLTGRVWWDVE